MKLNKLQLCGFKSFAEPTEFSFAEGLTGVVGPNGCGKSNIVDAIKWVLGNRSAKSLRGEEMLDVIFNGGNGTPSASFAEVSLSFTNNDKTLPLDYDEITVTRRLYRSGESEYLINNQTCRLKDIRELFMDTGVGMESYSIVEQGKVDFILNSNPVERRAIFEEAAGISKYKSRKKEAEGKLERVQQDLVRLSDVTREIKKEIRSLKIQATRAQKYKQLAEEVKQKKLLLFLHQFHQLKTSQAATAGQLTALAEELNSVQNEIKSAEGLIINLEKEIIRRDNSRGEQQKLLVEISSQISALTSETENNRKRQQELEDEEIQAKKQLAGLTQQAVAIRQTLVETMHLLETAKQEAEMLFAQVQEQENLVNEFGQEENDLTGRREAKRSEVFEITTKKSQYQNELTGVQNELKNYSTRRDKSEMRQKEIAVEIANIAKQITEINEEIGRLQNTRESLKRELVQSEQVAKLLKDDLTLIEKTLNEHQSETQKKLARKEILEDLENHQEGLNSGVKAVLEAVKSPADQPTGLFIHGILADLIQVDPRYVSAIESALGDFAQAIVTRSLNDSRRIIEFAKSNRKGKITTIAVDLIPNNFNLNPGLPNLPGVIGKASQLVKTDKKFEPVVEYLLGPYILVENLEVAQDIFSNNHSVRPVVTLAGETITAEGIISVGATESGISILSRKTELHTVNEELLAISEKTNLLTEQKSAKSKELADTEKNAQKYRQDIYEQEITLLDKRKCLEEIDRRKELLNKEQEINRLELEEVVNQINSLAERAISIAEMIKQLADHLTNTQSELEKLNNTLTDLNERKKSGQAKLTELKINYASVNEKKEYLNTSLNQLNNQISQIESSLNKASENINDILAKKEALKTALVKSEQQLTVLTSQREQVQTNLNNLNQSINQLKNDLSDRKVEITKLNEILHNKESRHNELTLTEQEVNLKLNGLQERGQEETGCVLAEHYQTYTDDPNTNWDEMTKFIAETKEKLAVMTDVNLASIDQLKELEERALLYETQEQDLIKTKHSLQEIIRKMNRASREKFEAVFARIQENFNTLFRKLFGGGKAELILCAPKHNEISPSASIGENTPPAETSPAEVAVNETEPPSSNNHNDILECGIEIMAKPPGKEPTSISLLSGGEKTMTALALIMGIFQLRPSPFCIMDEADATLDESNVGRFVGLIKEYSQTTQFVVISHNNKTMVMMDRLYGLTMQKSGVSQKVSVQMAEEQLEPALAN